ncbi:hypothetical protein AAG906_011217 [Vitis piasezkii]
MGEPSPLRNPLGTRGSACVEVMTTLHGSTLSPWRRAEGCIPLEGTIASARDPLTHSFCLIEPSQPCRAALVTIGFIILFMVSFWCECYSLQFGFDFYIELEIDWSRFQRTSIQDEMSYDSLPPTPPPVSGDIVEDLIDMVFFMMGPRWTCWMILIPKGCMVDDLDGNQFSEPTNVDQLKKYYV